MIEVTITSDTIREVMERFKKGIWVLLLFALPVAVGWWLILNDIHDQAWMLGMVIGPIVAGFVIGVVGSYRENPNKTMPAVTPGPEVEFILKVFATVFTIPIIAGGIFVYDYVFHYLTNSEGIWQSSDAYHHFESFAGMLVVWTIWKTFKYLWKRRKAKAAARDSHSL